MKTGDTLREAIAAAAITLCVAVLVIIWFFKLATFFREQESLRHRSVETRADSAAR